jgi:sugar lactone lactonase YvrE
MHPSDLCSNTLKVLSALVIVASLAACGGEGFAQPGAIMSSVPAAPAPPASAPVSPPAPSADALNLFAGNIGGSGNLDGTGAAARFYFAEGMAGDAAGNLYVADAGNATIRKISPSGVVTTIAGLAGAAGSTDGDATTARFFFPQSVVLDAAGNLFVLDTGNNTVRKISSSGMVSTIAGVAGVAGSADGSGAAASFNNPGAMAIDSAGNLYITDSGNHTVRKLTPAGIVSTLAGTPGIFGFQDGAGSAARFNSPFGVAVDGSGTLYVADTSNAIIRKITPAGVVSTFVGSANAQGSSDGTGASARFANPAGVALDGSGNLYVADSLNDTIRVVTPAGVVSTLAGAAGVKGAVDGDGAAARFNDPFAIYCDSTGRLFVADGYNNVIRSLTTGGKVTTLAGTASVAGSADGLGAAATFNLPSAITGDSAGNVYVAEFENDTIRKATPAGLVSTLAGKAGVIGAVDGNGTNAEFSFPGGIAADAAGNLYVADSENNAIRKVSPSGDVTTFAGIAGAARGSTDGTGAAARFFGPIGITSDASGNLFVTDTFNSTIRRITAAGVVTTFSGTPEFEGSADGVGAAASFSDPRGICSDPSGNLFVADTDNDIIRRIAPDGTVSTVAGTAFAVGSADGAGAAATFYTPSSIACDGNGNVYVADTNNHTVRKITPAGVVSTVIGVAGKVGLTLGPLPATLGNITGIGVVGAQLFVLSDNAVVWTGLP